VYLVTKPQYDIMIIEEYLLVTGNFIGREELSTFPHTYLLK